MTRTLTATLWREEDGYVSLCPDLKQCSRSFHTAERRLEGVEALHMVGKGQVKRLNGRDVIGQARFVEVLFGVAA